MNQYMGIIIAVAVIVVIAVILFTGYKKAPPDTAFIISGLRKKIIKERQALKFRF